MKTEVAILGALRRGDEAAFTALVERNHAAMVHLAMGFVRNRATAEEVAQDAWLGFLDGLERFEARSTIRTFLLSIVANKARTRGQRDARSVPLSSLLGDEGAEGSAAAEERLLTRDRGSGVGRWAAGPSPWSELPERRLIDDETNDLVLAAVDTLPSRQRTVTLLHDVHGLSSAEIQSVLGLSEGNARVLLHRGRTRVRAALASYLDEPAAA